MEREYVVFFFKQKAAYEIKECDWSSDVCSSDLGLARCAVSSQTPRHDSMESRRQAGARAPEATPLGTHARVPGPLAHQEPALLHHAWGTPVGPRPVVGEPARSNTGGTGFGRGQGLAVPGTRMGQPRRRVAGPYSSHLSSRSPEVGQGSTSGGERRLSEEPWRSSFFRRAKPQWCCPSVTRKSSRAAQVQLSRVIPHLDKGPLSVGNSLRIWRGC